jgi:hypothetical protein
LLGALAIWRAARGRGTPAPALSEAEEARLAAIVEEGERRNGAPPVVG